MVTKVSILTKVSLNSICASLDLDEQVEVESEYYLSFGDSRVSGQARSGLGVDASLGLLISGDQDKDRGDLTLLSEEVFRDSSGQWWAVIALALGRPELVITVEGHSGLAKCEVQYPLGICLASIDRMHVDLEIRARENTQSQAAILSVCVLTDADRRLAHPDEDFWA